MYKHYFVGAALLLSTATAGLAVAAALGESGFLTGQRDARTATLETVDRGGRPILIASKAREHNHHADRLAKRDRRHHDDDDDDDDDEDRGRSMNLQNGPVNPSSPIPDNGLFNGNSRPKVQVQ